MRYARLPLVAVVPCLLCAVWTNGFAPSPALGQEWELRRDDLSPERPPVEKGVVNIRIGDAPARFPRHLNELGVRCIRIAFRAPAQSRRRLSVVWTGGSQGPDQFEVLMSGSPAGATSEIDTARRPYAWYQHEFPLSLGAGEEHTIELRSPPGMTSAIELTGIRLAAPDAPAYQPLCYESIGTLERYERELGGKGVLVSSGHLSIFAPADRAGDAKGLSELLEKAWAEMRAVYGIDPVFRFSIEHYPKGHKRGWGGISGAGTIGYTVEALDKYARLRMRDVNGFVGYTEEMSHGFKAYYRADGTYEALGVAVQEDIVRRLVPPAVADRYWLPEHASWKRTHEAYLAAGRRNPDPAQYPWNVLYTRILNDVFLKLRTEYGPNLWPDFFRLLREKDYPLHRATKTQRMGVYADLFGELLKQDMRKRFTAEGIDLDADPPWGSETYTR